MAEVELFKQFPQVIGRIPHVTLCALPTPVERLTIPQSDRARLFVKRDDVSAEDYGGNKIRKLEFLLADALSQGARQVLTFGYAGSNFATATAIYAEKLGMRSHSMLLPQRVEPYVEQNLRASQAAGATIHLRRSVRSVGAAAVLTSMQQMLVGRRRPYWIPAGGSSPLGVLGFVNAGLELLAQVDRGELAMPDRIYVAAGSMGTVAGLSIALQLKSAPTEVVSCQVIGDSYANPKKLRQLIQRTAQLMQQRVPGLDLPDISDANVCWRDDFYGGEYGLVTPEAAAAMDVYRRAKGGPLDTTYSAKAFAAMLHDLDTGDCDDQTLLFWNTHNSQPLSAYAGQVPVDALPRRVQRYLTRG